MTGCNHFTTEEKQLMKQSLRGYAQLTFERGLFFDEARQQVGIRPKEQAILDTCDDLMERLKEGE